MKAAPWFTVVLVAALMVGVATLTDKNMPLPAVLVISIIVFALAIIGS